MKTVYVYLLAILLLFACRDKNNGYDATGIFETTEVIVSAEGNGKIFDFNLLEGDRVEVNSPLGYIDTIQLYLQKQQLVANQGAVKSNYSNVSTQIAALEQQIQTQITERTRYENLVKANAANQKQLDDINSQLAVLQRQLAAQKETLQNSNNSVNEQSTGIEVQIAQLNDQIQKSIITSPITGTVLSKYAENGEFAVQGKALFKVGDIENMFLRAYITSSQLTEVQIGQQVNVFADYGEKERREYQGVVSWVSDKSEFTPKTIQTRDEKANTVYAVKIAVKNDGYIKRGMYGEVKWN
ncbi:MAG: HlyD family efflux transporter periplasmic adaptor subunit [Odoribacter sp.]|nr:HlyD family efflux transporter periplasmic adaptor subunit [Odoribacter sp.]